MHNSAGTAGGLAINVRVPQMDKRSLSERDICTKFITPAIQAAGWDLLTQVREEVTLTAGRVVVRGNLAVRNEKTRKRADYVLYLRPNLPLAVIEAKDNNQPVGGGMQQALGYAELLDVPCASSSNGDAFLVHDRTGQADPREQQVGLEAFPPPPSLWDAYQAWRGLPAEAEKVVTHPYHDDGSGKAPRYYQQVAIQKTLEAVARGQRRVLLVMATGTGKTYTAFQIIWRLWKAGAVKRVLFLADRNILVDQTIVNDFKPFGSVMTKIQNRNADPAYEVYLALYQAVSGEEEWKNVYREFSPDFFDLVVVDECHRGSARDDSAWREILDHFESAIHLGMTATPKETKYVSNITYFGEPVFTYSLRQGIDDGFLAPYKVVRIDLDRDLAGWRPPAGMQDDLGQDIEDRIYNQKDMDRFLVLNERTKRVAEKVIEYILGTDPHGKTIVFCEDIDHAERMRSALVNEVARKFPEEAGNAKYVMRITGDSPEGKAQLDNFIDPEKRYPTIVTTSKLLTTGVDAQTCKLIVIDQTIQSVGEFKQIVGRGTRIREEYNKLWFTIMDFRKATELFADPAFDGEPEVIYEPGDDEGPIPPPDDGGGDEPPVSPPDPPGSRKYYVRDVAVSVIAERVQYLDPQGRLITESLRDYTRKTVRGHYETLDEFLRRWSAAERKAAVISELAAEGVFFEDLEQQVGQGYDAFDLVCHVAFDRPPLSRQERAQRVRKRDVFTRYGEQARAVLDALLDKYAEEGLAAVEDLEVLRVRPLADLGTPVELVQSFGGKAQYLQALREMEAELYRATG